MRLSISGLSALLLIAAIRAAGAQDIASLQAGARIRLDPVYGGAVTATLSGVSPDSIKYLLERSGAQVTALGLSEVKRLDVSRGRSRKRGALLKGLTGLAVGAAGGAALGALTYEEYVQERGDWLGCLIICSRGDNALYVGSAGGLAGVVLGTIYGAVMGHEQWERVPLRSR
ncbi:MAG: hypothetical protein WKF55_15920 [Gemmatimonadaceae bacterium]